MNFLKKAGDSFGSGQTMTEYVLIVSAIAIVLIGGYNAMGGMLATLVRTLAAEL
jgi:Flp pilus assembly pilin Flp